MKRRGAIAWSLGIMLATPLPPGPQDATAPPPPQHPVQLPPGTYRVDAAGNMVPVMDLQRVLEKIPWEKADKLVETWVKKGSLERVVNVVGMYVLVGIVVGSVVILGFKGVLEGQAIAGFLGAAVGYLLSRADIGGGE